MPPLVCAARGQRHERMGPLGNRATTPTVAKAPFSARGRPLRSTARLVVMALVDGDCPHCGHEWGLHPVATQICACADCVIEEDHGKRQPTDVCDAVHPALRGLASTLVVAKQRRRRFGRWEVVLLEHSGAEWRTFGKGRSEQAARQLRSHVATELESSTLADFCQRHAATLH